MENNPTHTSSTEAPSTSPDDIKKSKEKPSKKSLFKPEQLDDTRKQQAKQRLSRALDASPIFEKSEDKNHVSVANDHSEEAADLERPESLNAEDINHANKAIADDHLETMQAANIDAQQQLSLAREFLQRVSNGEEVEAAASDVAAEHGLDSASIETAADVNDATDHEAVSDIPANEASESDDESPSDASGTSVAASGSGGSTGGGGSASGPTGPMNHRNYNSGSGSGVGAVPSYNVLPDAANTYYSQRVNRGELLLGGIVGYLIGRRRGRIKTENKLLPVQAQLRKQVAGLESVITQKEQQLTKLQAKNNQLQRSDALSNARLRERVQPGNRETRLGLQKPARAEQLGHILVAAEAPRTVIQTKLERPGNIREAFRAEEVKMMDRRQLLELSEKITVEGASLRRMYESNLIGERQLRHLVGEYLSGHDIHDELRRSIVEREIDFERDPLLRDRIRGGKATAGDAGGTGQSAGASSDAHPSEQAAEAERAKTAERQRKSENERSARVRPVADVAMATAIVVLAVVVIMLVLRR